MRWSLIARASLFTGLFVSIFFLFVQHPVTIADRDLSSDLIDVPLPRRNFNALSYLPHHNRDNAEGYTYATMLCTPVPDARDPFWAATQSLIWRILWSEYRSKYPITVFTCPSTPSWQKRTMRGMGAQVMDIELIAADTTKLHLSRWRDQLAKLNLWKHVEFNKIVFLDSDAFPIDNIDELFETPSQRCLSDDGSETCEYTFAGAEMSDTDHELNGGVFVMVPSLAWHGKLLVDVQKTDQYDSQTAEQGLLNSDLAFGLTSNHPRQTLSQKYNADKEFYGANMFIFNESSIKVIHCKMWSPMSTLWAPELSTRWDVDWMTMSRWYDDDNFEFARREGRIKSYFEIVAEKENNKGP